MRVVILGGGIAGLSIGIYLFQNAVDVVINERQLYSSGGGHAFLMHQEGFSVLKELAGTAGFSLPGKLVDNFVLRRPDGQTIMEQSLEDWQCFKRTDLLDCLIGLLPSGCLKNNRTFSHFLYEQERVKAAVFLNGDIEYGDIFIGADGSNSIVRGNIFGEVAFQPGKVKELVGITTVPELAEELRGRFTKFISADKGLSFGIIPTSATEVVWFMQFDPSLGDLPEGALARSHQHYPEQLREFSKQLLVHFPPEVHTVLAANDFRTSYVWNTRDFDLLPSFHSANVVLIGDAAHVSLPFTSAGTTNAMLDARALKDALLHHADAEEAFAAFYHRRSRTIAEHIRLGRQLRDAFLHAASPVRLPLISDQSAT